MRHLALSALLLAGGYNNLAGAFIDTSGKSGRSVQRVKPPKVDRCRSQQDLERRAACDEKRQQALAFARKLAVDDQVCLELCI